MQENYYGAFLSFNLERTRVENHFYNLLIDWMSQVLNTLPFWLSPGSYCEFDNFKKWGVAGHQQCEKLIEIVQREYNNELIQEAVKLCKQRVQQRKLLSQQISLSLEKMVTQLKTKKEDSDIDLMCRKLIQSLGDIQKILDNAQFGDMNWKPAYLDLHPKLEEKYKAFFEQLAKMKQKILNNTTLGQMQQESFASDQGLRESDFRWAKYCQHRIHALEKLFLEPDSILHSSKPKPLLVIDWLPKNDYADLLFLLSVISAEHLETCLEQKIILYEEIIEHLQQQGEQLKTHWGEETRSIVRVFRTIGIYQRWEKALEQALGKIENIQNTDWVTLFALYRLFTYEKKTFFTEALKKENAITIFKELTLWIAECPEFKNPQKALNYMNNEKKLIKKNLERKQTTLMEKYQVWEKMVTFLGLSLTEQAAFKLGTIGFDIGFDSMSHLEKINPEKTEALYNKIDDIGNRLIPTWIQAKLNPERDVKIIQYLTGLFCFCAEQGVSSWMGYAYRSIAAVNRVLFSQFDTWVSFGEKIGLDEIGLLEKEGAMHWLSGLGLYFLIQGRDMLVPTFLSYTAATSAAHVSVMIVDDLIQHKEWNPKVIAVGKFAIQASVYSRVYASIFKMGIELFPPTSEWQSYAKALKTMGFFEQPDKKELQKRYHELARENHPDKCIQTCHNENRNTVTTTEPEENHLNTNTPINCIDFCKSNDETMREINQAYSYLKALK